MASRVRPKSENVLKVIKQGERETLLEYNERFNKEVLNVMGLEGKTRLFFMKDGLRKGCLFHIVVSVNRP